MLSNCGLSPGGTSGIWGWISSFWGLDIYMPENKPLPCPKILQCISWRIHSSGTPLRPTTEPQDRSQQTGWVFTSPGPSCSLYAERVSSALDLPLRYVIVQNKEEVRRERIERRLRTGFRVTQPMSEFRLSVASPVNSVNSLSPFTWTFLILKKKCVVKLKELIHIRTLAWCPSSEETLHIKGSW